MGYQGDNDVAVYASKMQGDMWLALLQEESARLQAQGHHVAISFAATPPSIRSSTRPLSIAFADMLRDGARLL